MPGTAGFQARTSGASIVIGRIVQDAHEIADYGRSMTAALLAIAGLIAFSFVSSVTPGPNNVLLCASGMRFGVRRTVPHILGTALGIGGLAIAVAAGLGALLDAFPPLAAAMRLA